LVLKNKLVKTHVQKRFVPRAESFLRELEPGLRLLMKRLELEQRAAG
jgi:hypothetical protein